MLDHPTPLGGKCNARFGPLRELFAAKLKSGEDLGASLAVNIAGEMVVDLVMGIQPRMGIGYGLLPMPQVLSFLPEGRLCTWGGAGGSLVIADVEPSMTFAYVMNKMRPNVVGPIAEALVERLYALMNR